MAPDVMHDFLGGNFTFDGDLEDLLEQFNMTQNAPPLAPALKLLRDISQWMEHVVLPIIIIFGLLGNGISFLVFIFSHLRRLSASVYLAALSLANSGYLICRSVKWAHGLGVRFLLNTDSGCQTFLFLNYVFRFLSVWYVVSFTVERYIAVCQPFQRQDLCTPKRAKIVVTTLALWSFALYSFVIWTSGVTVLYGISECLPKTKYMPMWTFILSVDTMSTLLVPSAAIFVLNIMIICAVYRIHRDPTIRRSLHIPCRMLSAQSRTNGGSRHNDNNNITTYCCSNRRGTGGGATTGNSPQQLRPSSTLTTINGGAANTSQVKVTKMLVIVSSTFLLLNLPIHSLTVFHHVRSYVLGPGNRPSKTFIYLQRFFLLIHDSNFAVNFIIYNLCGRNFRSGLERLIKKIRLKLRRCGRKRHFNTTPATTTMTLLPVHKVNQEFDDGGGALGETDLGDPGGGGGGGGGVIQANGMHYMSATTGGGGVGGRHSTQSRSRSTSSSGNRSYVMTRGRARCITTSQGSQSFRWDTPEHS